MRNRTLTVLIVAVAGLGAATTAVVLNSTAWAFAPATPKGAVVEPSEKPLLEGPILYAAYDQENGKVGGFTRADNPKAVPGGNGSWNEQRYGKLYRDYLVVTHPAKKNWGVLVIPAGRLREVHFADE
jgi:hypothetical protein